MDKIMKKTIYQEGEKTIYELELHEELRIVPDLYIIRVPGGWIYCTTNDNLNFASSTFVPYNNEFESDEEYR